MPELTNDLSLVVLATLLSLLPVVILFWTYYMREREPSIPGRAITQFFAAGMFSVVPAILLERWAFALAGQISPVAARAFFTEFFELAGPVDLLLAAAVPFGIVATVEEGVRLLFLKALLRRSEDVDQMVDGLQAGISIGIGFAFVENTLYFLRLFRSLDFDTLAVVFFLRFLISTFGHISFGGLMGYFLVRAAAQVVERRRYLLLAFFVPWAAHGLFDLLLSIRLSAYTVLFLLLPLAALWALYRQPELHQRFRLHGRTLRAPTHARPVRLWPWRRPPLDLIPQMPWCPVCLTPTHTEQSACPVCGMAFRRKARPSSLPFATS